MRVEDGSATVTGDKLPKGHWEHPGKAGARLEARSQETDLANAMKSANIHFIVLTVLLFGVGLADQAVARFADSVIDYQPGSGIATDFETGEGFTDTDAVIGAPSRENPGSFGGPVTPFSPPFTKQQLLSVGENGTLTVRFDSPITDAPTHPYGIDFIIFGNSGFTITNGNFSGGGITDGSLFGNNTGETRVLVSQDNETYYELHPGFAPTVDGLYPTDGAGDFQKPVDPSLSGSDFAGLGLSEIRASYGGSGGGTGFDLAWAHDGSDQQVPLDQVQYVRVEVASGHSEIDAFASVPEADPLILAMLAAGLIGGWRVFRRIRYRQCLLIGGLLISIAAGKAEAAGFTESFASDPFDRGWQVTGTASLFEWDQGGEHLHVTWNTEEPNSFFYRKLPVSLSKNDHFRIAFDIRLTGQEIDFEAGSGYAFEIAVGLLNLSQATGSDFHRDTGSDSPNLVEWDYFPDTGFGATISPAIVSSESRFATTFNFPLPLTVGEEYHISLRYIASDQTLRATMEQEGEPFGPIKNPQIKADSDFSDFEVDAFSISSYHDGTPNGAFQIDGIIDNVVVEYGNPPVRIISGKFVNDNWEVTLLSQANREYSLERSLALRQWQTIVKGRKGNGDRLTLVDSAPPQEKKAFYRVRAQSASDANG